MPRSSLLQFVDRGQYRRPQSVAERRALLLENLRLAEDCALLARRYTDRAAAFLAIARGAYQATIS